MRNTMDLKKEFAKGTYDSRLQEIYLDESQLDRQRERYVQALEQYEKLFGADEVSIYSAPGRSEVGGNHTDHQHGKVLAASVNLDAIGVVGYNRENCVRVVSDGYDMQVVQLDDLEKKEEEEGTSLALIRGVLSGLAQRGYQLGGCNIYSTSNVLIGAGLSSSAAFETIIGTILSGMFNEMKVSAVEIAQIGQYAENVYFGKPCGLMDQMACSVGGLIYIDFQDPNHPVVEQVDARMEEHQYSLCIVDTKGSHADLTDEYAMIPLEMKQVAEYFGKEVLRDVNKNDLYLKIAELRQHMGDRCVLRAIHFFEENRRVERQVQALKDGDFAGFLNLVKQSGNSSFQYLQNIYSNRNVQDQSMSIGLAVSDSVLDQRGVCRVHGGGFAGTIQAFVTNEFAEFYRGVMDSVFGEGACHVLKIRTFGGMKVL